MQVPVVSGFPVIIVRRVLFGNHMLDKKRNERSGVLRKMTILATIARSLPNQVFGRRIHVRNYDEPKNVEPSIGLWISVSIVCWSQHCFICQLTLP